MSDTYSYVKLRYCRRNSQNNKYAYSTKERFFDILNRKLKNSKKYFMCTVNDIQNIHNRLTHLQMGNSLSLFMTITQFSRYKSSSCHGTHSDIMYIIMTSSHLLNLFVVRLHLRKYIHGTSFQYIGRYSSHF